MYIVIHFCTTLAVLMCACVCMCVCMCTGQRVLAHLALLCLMGRCPVLPLYFYLCWMMVIASSVQVFEGWVHTVCVEESGSYLQARFVGQIGTYCLYMCASVKENDLTCRPGVLEGWVRTVCVHLKRRQDLTCRPGVLEGWVRTVCVHL